MARPCEDLFRAIEKTLGENLPIFAEDLGATILIMPFGGFLTLGMLIALMQYALKKSEKKKQLAAEAAKEAEE